jgi:prefoldin subunit 5
VIEPTQVDYLQAHVEALEAERDRLKAQLAVAMEALESIRKHEFCAGNQAQEALARIKELGE